MGALVHAALSGGQAAVQSTVRIGASGRAIDLPLGHEDNVWVSDTFDATTLCGADARLLGRLPCVVYRPPQAARTCGAGPVWCSKIWQPVGSGAGALVPCEPRILWSC
ncbi:amino acid synthesis family protein [Rhodobacteraceae bacterium SC52]|nr:amino acid synthesis family protein [Rhodobacteraceae bacterium SC52]